MEEMELIIKIPKDRYEFLVELNDRIKKGESIYKLTGYDKAIANGILLPKNHGKLIDSDWLDKRLRFVLNHTGGYKKTLIGTGIVIAMAENLDAPIIIEADTESEK